MLTAKDPLGNISHFQYYSTTGLLCWEADPSVTTSGTHKRTGKVEQQPEVIMRGFGGSDITEQAKDLVLKTLDGLSTEQKSDYGMVKEKVRAELKRLIQKTTGRRPMIMPVILEI